MNKIDKCNICHNTRNIYNLEIYNLENICGRCHRNMFNKNINIENVVFKKDKYEILNQILNLKN